MPSRYPSPPTVSPPSRSRWILLVAAIPLALHLWPNADYGYFNDEFYYLSCASHPAAGYVDHPPLSILLLALVRGLLGDSLLALRLLPAVASAALVVLAASTARRLGGGGTAQLVAAAGVAFAPGLLVLFDFYSMNGFEVLLWSLALHLYVRRVREDRPRLWLWLGVVGGFAALNKHTIVLLAGALGLGMLTTRQGWRDLRGRHLWLGVAVALLIAAPNLIWQLANGFPSLEFYANAQAGKNIATPPLDVLLGQLLITGLPVWIVGLVAVLVARRLRVLRALGVAYLVLFVLMVFTGASRPDRIAGIYPVLFAAAGVVLEAPVRRGLLARIAVAATILTGVLALPISVAAVPLPLGARVGELLGSLTKVEQGPDQNLPLWLSARRGWAELGALVEDAVTALPADERPRACVLASFYGAASAIEHHTDAADLPPIYCPHNAWWHWARPTPDRDVVVCVGFAPATLERIFARVERVGQLRCKDCRVDGIEVYVGREPRAELRALWDQLRMYR